MKYYGIGTILLGLAVGTVQADPVQWSVADGGNGHWYEQINTGSKLITWQDAFEIAESMGGHLVTITSQEEDSFVHSSFSCNTGWAGGTRENGEWNWITGEVWDYTNWHPGEPNGGDGSHLEVFFNCIAWNDMHASYQRDSLIVEWEPLPLIQWSIEDGGNGHWYELVVPKSTVTWNEANADAESSGGYLATATSGAENQWIFDTFDLDDYDSYWETGGGTGPALGALWNVNLQAWEWNTGETWDYENWREGQDQPNPPDADWGMSYSTLDGVPTPSNLWQHVPVNGGIVHVSYVIEFTTLPGSALGACCLDGLCITTAAADCSGNSGSWGGPDSSCADFDCPVSCPGDLDGDGIVKVQDLLILIANWGVCP